MSPVLLPVSIVPIPALDFGLVCSGGSPVFALEGGNHVQFFVCFLFSGRERAVIGD